MKNQHSIRKTGTHFTGFQRMRESIPERRDRKAIDPKAEPPIPGM